MADQIVKICQNRGCGKRYTDEINNSDACRFHPDPPVFRDILKVWPCCNQKSKDFSTFVNLPGCKVAPHSDVALATLPEAAHQESPPEIIIPSAPIARTYQSDMSEPVPLQIIATPELEAQLSKISSSDILKENGHEEVTVITLGTQCLNSGCGRKYTGCSDDLLSCSYHPGNPVFHEGYKYWSCCRKKTIDFDEFLKQIGCETGRHRWTLSQNEIAAASACSLDYFQSGSSVSINIFAKFIWYQECLVCANKTQLKISLLYGEKKLRQDMKLNLYDEIDVSRTSVQVTPYKMIINCQKMAEYTWPHLERQNQQETRE